uniref:Uncharacterized protein n=1 Tax=Oryza sativa subsp. japonica TaxID=39947 RepID=Q6YVJ7_ORYSJ|nr:hypothetical protein [Oryza sativa Japonica Group]BAD08068.1 hypothetical protein [Oryza sativa Japonica Group]
MDLFHQQPTGGATAGESGGGGGGRVWPRQAKLARATAGDRGGRWGRDPGRAPAPGGDSRGDGYVAAGGGGIKRGWRSNAERPRSGMSLPGMLMRSKNGRSPGYGQNGDGRRGGTRSGVGRRRASGRQARRAVGRADGKRADEHGRRRRGPQRRRWPKEERGGLLRRSRRRWRRERHTKWTERTSTSFLPLVPVAAVALLGGAQRGGVPQRRERTERGEMRPAGGGKEATPRRRSPAAPPASPPPLLRPRPETPLLRLLRPCTAHARSRRLPAVALGRCLSPPQPRSPRHCRSACSSVLTPPLHLLQPRARPSPLAAGKERGEEREEERKEKKNKLQLTCGPHNFNIFFAD